MVLLLCTPVNCFLFNTLLRATTYLTATNEGEQGGKLWNLQPLSAHKCLSMQNWNHNAQECKPESIVPSSPPTH